MATAVTQLVRPPLHSLPLPREATVPADVRPSSELRATRARRLGSLLLDGGILVAGVWSIPFVIIAMGTPIALAILGVLQLVRLLQNAF